MRERTVEKLYTLQEAAEMMSMHRTTVWRLVRSGKLRPIERLGERMTRIPASTINRYRELCRVP